MLRLSLADGKIIRKVKQYYTVHRFEGGERSVEELYPIGIDLTSYNLFEISSKRNGSVFVNMDTAKLYASRGYYVEEGRYFSEKIHNDAKNGSGSFGIEYVEIPSKSLIPFEFLKEKLACAALDNIGKLGKSFSKGFIRGVKGGRNSENRDEIYNLYGHTVVKREIVNV